MKEGAAPGPRAKCRRDVRPGSRTVCLLTFGAVLVLASAGYSFRGGIAEEYWIRVLSRGDNAQRRLAAERLGEMRSVRGAASLVDALVNGEKLHATYSGTEKFAGSSFDPLLRPIQFSGVKDSCVEALLEIGSPALPALIYGLRHSHEEVRWTTACILGKMGHPARSATPALLERKLDPHEEEPVRWAAARALALIEASVAQLDTAEARWVEAAEAGD